MIVQTKITAPVGAAIGRPSVGICSDVKQHASAVKISAISPVGLTQKRYATFLMRIACMAIPDEQCSPLQLSVLLYFCTRRGGHWPSACENLPRRPRRNFTIESILTLGYNVPYTGIISFALPCASKTAKMPVITAPRRTQHTINCAPAQQKRKKQHERINRKKKPPGCPKRGHL